MPTDRASALRFLIYVALYVAAAEFAVVFIALPTDVTLIWPSAGIAYAVMIYHGTRWWPVIPCGILLTHLLVTPAPWAFIPFSVASNTVASVLATTLALRIGGKDLVTLRVGSGFVLLVGGVISASISALIGVTGMVLAGMIAPHHAIHSVGKWFAGDVFGIIVVTPFMLMVLRSIERGTLVDTPLEFAGRLEKTLWLVSSAAGMVIITEASSASPAYALGLSFLPLAFLLWSALRFEPIMTAGATMLFAFVVVTLIGLGIGGFSAPSGLLETFILLLLLSIMGVVPQLVGAGNYRVRAGAFDMLQRARTDRLTGLPSRTSFEETLAQTLAARPEIARGGAIAYVDMDEFKLINDTASHAAGDEAIRQIASVMRSKLSDDVLLARLGADEFGILWPAADLARAESDARELRIAISEFRFAHADHVFALTASIGIVPFPPRRATVAEVFAQADTACYAAKELGGNRIQVQSPDNPAVVERTAAMGWIVRINDALENDRFDLYGQRILAFKPEPFETFEILLRLRGDDGEALLPSRFIPAAERFQLAGRIDRHVIDRSLRWLETDPRARGVHLNINLSASTLADEDFSQFLRQRLKSSSIDPEQICLEITETSAVRDLDHARQLISQFKAIGVRFALDDFGTGFCSFAYLRDLDVDVFKIDGSFVRDFDQNELSMAIVKSIVEIARVLGKRTVAESVEDPRLGRGLQELGVDAVQGYAYHRPEPLRLLLAQAA
ncbi:MAG TPA: EAL domain-containing protein [Xanthomonadales bacterium]|nr:EAL domain-containing protein [Xanthomonadales bacterium]